MNASEAYREAAKLIHSVPHPKNRSVKWPYSAHRLWRGQQSCVVGYAWTRPYAHHMNGKVYDCVVGYGNTFQEALSMMRKKAGLPPEFSGVVARMKA